MGQYAPIITVASLVFYFRKLKNQPIKYSSCPSVNTTLLFVNSTVVPLPSLCEKKKRFSPHLNQNVHGKDGETTISRKQNN